MSVLTVPASHGSMRRIGAPIAAAARGAALGGVLVALGAAAVAGQNMHFLTWLGDGLLGILLIVVAIGLVWILLAVPSWLIGRLLALAARRLTWISDAAADAVVAVLHAVRHPLVAAAVAIGAMLWLLPADGPLAMFRSLVSYEILILTGALVGLLLGLAAWERRNLASRRSLQLAVPVVMAVLLAGGVSAWAVTPGMGDPIVREAPGALAVVSELDLPDPSAPGPYTVEAATYGSGTDRRTEYGEGADWITPTVNASAALNPRDSIGQLYADWLWGFRTNALPLNGRVWYPADAPGRLPLVLVVHGNHAAGEYSDPGYEYLGEHLAGHGMIAVSVDENFLNGDAFFDYGGQEQAVRAWLLLRHLDQFRTWDGSAEHALSGRIDLDRVALMGHSRGGEAVTVAAALEASEAELPGLPALPRGFGIRAVVAIAPSDGQYSGPLSPVSLTDVDYLVLQGAHDADLPAFTGLGPYHRVTFTPGSQHLKAAVYSQRANHGRFNTVWDVGDAGPLASWMLERGSILDPAEQQRLAKAVIGAFLQRSLLGETGYDAFFREPRAGRAWLPDDVVLTHWQTSERLVVDDFAKAEAAGDLREAVGFDEVQLRDPLLRDKTVQGDRGLRLAWSQDASYRVVVPDAARAAVDPSGALVFSMALADVGMAPSVSVELTGTDGRVARIDLADVAPIRPALPVRLWKLDLLGDRYMPSEKLAWPAERFLQSYAIELESFTAAEPSFDLGDLESVTLQFGGSGEVFLDDIGFEGPVATG